MTNMMQTNIEQADVEVIAVKVVRPYVLDVTFSDGTQRQVDVEDQLWGEAFESLKDPDFFAQAMIDGGTVAWPNGADFAPEFLHDFPTGSQQAPMIDNFLGVPQPDLLAKVMDAYMQVNLLYQINLATGNGEKSEKGRVHKLTGAYIESVNELRSLLGQVSATLNESQRRVLLGKLAEMVEKTIEEMARL